jgi:hypothetical protein
MPYPEVGFVFFNDLLPRRETSLPGREQPLSMHHTDVTVLPIRP